jgi:hypothetical protein
MKIFLSKFLYYIGHIISIFMMCDLLSFLYPVYKKLMIWSSNLDKDGKVWEDINK